MSSTGTCPSCGSVLTFRVDTATIAVCEYCRSIVIRGGAQLLAVGKSNEILATGSVLAVGVEGVFRGRKLTLVGRTQLRHDLGGVWDEWLAVVEGRDGKAGYAWIAEHQGRLAFMVESDPAQAPRLSAPAQAQPGRAFTTSLGELIVVERGEATIEAEQGELPVRSLIGARRPFVDFTTRDGRAATLDFGAQLADGTRDRKRFFTGREVTLADLGLADRAAAAAALSHAAEAQALKCPHCGQIVEKKRTETESMTCGSCNSGLSVEKDGRLGFLFAQEKLPWKPWIAAGTRARIDEGFMRRARALGTRGAAVKRPWPTALDVEVVANVVRSVIVDGTRYFFQEHLLATEKDGFFWLVESDAEWLFVRNLDPGLVSARGASVVLEGRTFNFEQRVQARVDQVLGELYFKVQKGETSMLTDYKNAPRTLSKEETLNELVWTECLAIDRGDVARVFRIKPPSPPSFNDIDHSSSTSSHGSAELSAGGVAIAVICGILIVFFMVGLAMCEAAGHGGGGHYSGGGGGGSSFGK